jgi:hypothetical protein
MKEQYDTFIRRGWPPRIASIYSGWNAPTYKQKILELRYVVVYKDFWD